MKKAALFDMDGTLVDNSPVHVRAFEIFCARYGVTDWKEKLADSFGMGNDDIMRAVMEQAGLASEAKAIAFSMPVTAVAGMRLTQAEDTED